MNVIALQSGSNGNCIYVESDGVRLLFDAGISGKQAQARLAAHGRNIEDVHALIISHDHRDHSRCLGVYQRKFRLPVHITRGTLTVASKKDNLGSLSDIRHFIAGSALRFSNVDSAGLVRAAGSRLKWACLAHLSEDNNNPELAVATHRQQLGNQLLLFVASRYEATDVPEV